MLGLIGTLSVHPKLFRLPSIGMLTVKAHAGAQALLAEALHATAGRLGAAGHGIWHTASFQVAIRARKPDPDPASPTARPAVRRHPGVIVQSVSQPHHIAAPLRMEHNESGTTVECNRKFQMQTCASDNLAVVTCAKNISAVGSAITRFWS